jgi:hypothetical protein
VINVPELDIFLKSAFYFHNSERDLYSSVHFSDRVTAMIRFVRKNPRIFSNFENTAKKPDLGFVVSPAQYLKIYPRLIYANGYLEQPESFDTFRYFLRYAPKMIVNIFQRVPNSSNYTPIPTHVGTVGSHTPAGTEHWIAYNVAMAVNIDTIVEEELHAQTTSVHGTTATSDVVARIRSSSPQLTAEIVGNLNLILSAEETKFKQLGDILRTEYPAELETLHNFVEMVEMEVIASCQ